VNVNSVPAITETLECSDIKSYIIAGKDVDIKLLEQAQQTCWGKHDSPRTEQVYTH
jgi:hypothetical protein